METRVIIIGGAGHALSVADAAQQAGMKVLGCVAPKTATDTTRALAWLGDESRLTEPQFADVHLINGIGSAGPISRRRHAFDRLTLAGRQFVPVRHPLASLSPLETEIGNGAQILAQAVVGPGVSLGDNVLINTAAVIEHGCSVGSHSHIASRAVLCGDCTVGEAVHIGAGAIVLQGVSIGYGAVIAAGAVITENVEPLTLVAGVPGREIRTINEKELA